MRGRPRDVVDDRMIIWWRGCRSGLTVREIAQQLGIKRETLMRSVQRRRAEGDEYAIKHPNATVPGEGLSHIVSPSARQRRTRMGRT
jgi:IS30 family transposase